MQKFLVVVECAIEFNNKFLFIKRPEGVHAGGLLAFPGGKVEYKDGSKHQDILINAVKREVLEEVGLNLIDPIHFITSAHFVDSNVVNVLDNIFYCSIESSSAEVYPSKREVANYYWLTLEEALGHANTPDWLKYYIYYINERKGLLKSFAK